MALGFLCLFLATMELLIDPTVSVATSVLNHLSTLPRPLAVTASSPTIVTFPATGAHAATCPELNAFSIVGPDGAAVTWRRTASRYEFEIRKPGKHTLRFKSREGAAVTLDFERLVPVPAPELRTQKSDRTWARVSEIVGLVVGLAGFALFFSGLTRGRTRSDDA